MSRKSKSSRSNNIEAPSPPSVRSQRLSLVAGAMLVSANLCLFGPFEIVTSNPAEFDVTFFQMLPLLAVMFISVAAVLSLVGFWAPSRARIRVISIYLAVGVLLWIQGSFLKWGYGEFDGKGIEWAVFTWQGWADLGIWLVLLAAAVYFSGRISRHVAFLAFGFIIIQSGLLVAQNAPGLNSSMEYTDAGDSGKKSKTVPPEMCHLSSTRNVFHIILDAFQTDVFLELVDEEDLADDLDGFVAYPENMSTGSQTALSVPALFSTMVYDGTVRQSEYFREATRSSYYLLLFQNDYLVNLIPHLRMPTMQGMSYFLCPRSYAAPPDSRMKQSLLFAVDVSMFRQLPHYAKRAVFNDENWRLSSIAGDPPNQLSFHQKAFFRDYISKLEAVHDRPAYHFLHLMPPHGPFVTLADGSCAGQVLPNTRENYKHEARYVLRLFIEFLDKLRRLNLYGSSLILMHGDHGMGLPPEAEPTRMRKRISSVSALLILKRPNAQGPLATSRAPTVLTDIPRTLMDLLEIKHRYPGESIVDLSETEIRDRSCVFLDKKSSREPVLNRWTVRGSITDSTSWQRQGATVVKATIHPYTWGKTVRFGAAQEGEVYLGAGFSAAAGRAWSDGKTAEIIFGIKPPKHDVFVGLSFFPYIKPGKVDRQRVSIWINDYPIGENIFTDGDGQVLEVRVPRGELQGDSLVVRFELPDAVIPREIGTGRDSRELAIALYSFMAKPVPDR